MEATDISFKKSEIADFMSDFYAEFSINTSASEKLNYMSKIKQYINQAGLVKYLCEILDHGNATEPIKAAGILSVKVSVIKNRSIDGVLDLARKSKIKFDEGALIGIPRYKIIEHRNRHLKPCHATSNNFFKGHDVGGGIQSAYAK